jgi:hypothetical protein
VLPNPMLKPSSNGKAREALLARLCRVGLGGCAGLAPRSASQASQLGRACRVLLL